MNLPLADTSDMIGLHQVFRDALAAGPDLVSPVVEGDVDRAVLVGSYYLNVLSLLHGHHDGEEELLTPKLLERCPEQAALVSTIAAQHGDVMQGIADTQAALATWTSTATESSRDEVATALAALQSNLLPHLDEEEENILPLAATCINVAEWGELPAHGMKSFTGDKLWLILGLIQEQMSAGQIADMEAHMPPPVAQFWQETGRGLFTDYVGELRG